MSVKLGNIFLSGDEIHQVTVNVLDAFDSGVFLADTDSLDLSCITMTQDGQDYTPTSAEYGDENQFRINFEVEISSEATFTVTEGTKLHILGWSFQHLYELQWLADQTQPLSI